MQREILGANPLSDLRVYVFWFNMYPGDERSKWDDALITDSRATLFWDEARIVGRWLVKNNIVQYRHEILWDAYLLFGPEAEWDTAPAPLISWGEPVYRRGQQFEDAMRPFLRG